MGAAGFCVWVLGGFGEVLAGGEDEMALGGGGRSANEVGAKVGGGGGFGVPVVFGGGGLIDVVVGQDGQDGVLPGGGGVLGAGGEAGGPLAGGGDVEAAQFDQVGVVGAGEGDDGVYMGEVDHVTFGAVGEPGDAAGLEVVGVGGGLRLA